MSTDKPIKLSWFIFSILILLFTSSCQRRSYVSTSLPGREGSLVSIAVLPYDILYTGSGVRHMTEEYMEEQKALQSLAFQRKLVNTIARNASRSRKVNVAIQAPQQTNSLLNDAGIDVLAARSQDFNTLTSVLNVDVVVVADLQKHSSFSQLDEGVSRWLARKRVTKSGTTALMKGFDVTTSLSFVDQNGTLLFDHFWDAGWVHESELDERLAVINNRLTRRLPPL